MESNTFSSSRIAVYARWRPPSKSELNASDPQIVTQTTTGPSPSSAAATALRQQLQNLLSIGIAKHNDEATNIHTTTKKSSTTPSSSSWSSPAAFTAVLGPDKDNRAVYDTVVAPVLPRVLAGSNFSVFAYGHSGSGKTHTIIGSGQGDDAEGSSLGLCLAAARDLFTALDVLNMESSSLPPDSDSASAHQLGIGLSVFELRKNTALDLLTLTSSSRPTECHVRQGPDGRTHIRGATELLSDGKVRVRPLTQLSFFTSSVSTSVAELQSALARGLSHRAVGSSSVHDASSRTHAVIELEIVSQALVDARCRLWDRQSELVPVGKRADDITVEEQSRLYLQGKDGKWMPNPSYVVDQERIDRAHADKAEYEARVAQAEDDVGSILRAAGGGVNSALGARMVFVDLAGAEYHADNTKAGGASSLAGVKQTPQERQEGRQINTDLLALKEVIRAWSNGLERVPFRASPLTMVLREHFSGLAGSAGGNDAGGADSPSKRSSSSAMVVTVSPAAGQYPATLNSLKYGSLVGAAGA
ncbi:kinesin family member 5 [Microdochium nivale]|nr:kinesin family member 5 [Microdochium nivale]